jgi:hypothetical protein
MPKKTCRRGTKSSSGCGIEPGIYNRAVLVAGTRSPFTYGLEMELRKLAQVDDEAVRNTALGPWVRDESIETPPPEDRPLLEVVPLNAEQRQAVVQGLSAPLTVVTGPPGTGKSQVVLSLLVNAAWQGSSVLFSSKNNHAVDVVESRVNELGSVPLLLRLGREEHHSRLAQHLTASLADSSSAGDQARYDRLMQVHEDGRARFEAVQREIGAVAGLRNTVDELERAVEPARQLFGADRFASLRTLDVNALRRGLETLGAAIGGATASDQPAVVRMVWDTVKDRRFGRISSSRRITHRRGTTGRGAPQRRTGRAGHRSMGRVPAHVGGPPGMGRPDSVVLFGARPATLRQTAREPGSRTDSDRPGIRPRLARIVAVLAAPVAWPLDS